MHLQISLAEDSLVLFSVVCVSGFNMCDGCKLVCVVVLHVIKHVTRENNQSLGPTRIHSFYIGDPAFEHAAMSNNEQLVQMNHIAVELSTFRVPDPAHVVSSSRSKLTSQPTMFDYVLEKLPWSETSRWAGQRSVW